MIELARKFWNDESGQGLAEYALLLGLIVIGVVVLIQGMGVSIKKIFTKANIDLEKAATSLPELSRYDAGSGRRSTCRICLYRCLLGCERGPNSQRDHA